MNELSLIELGAFGLLAVAVITKLFELLRENIDSSKDLAQAEFYRSFAEFQVEWRENKAKMDAALDLLREAKINQQVSKHELRSQHDSLLKKLELKKEF